MSASPESSFIVYCMCLSLRVFFRRVAFALLNRESIAPASLYWCCVEEAPTVIACMVFHPIFVGALQNLYYGAIHTCLVNVFVLFVFW